ncbi:hypothetical protein BV25DRAFT_1920831 [Artomyces pyxidatus]|uniref:Uncharacterized protein n=1 Tax=Artomyces pyxidatus TaxID=48021 RepID=A0ACB8SLD6_9AGAM|nr:hypothetical protein BV25DRAFT_1920831 [Artomyces pyxidatus]
MVDWHDPGRDERDHLTAIKLYRVLGGIYIWEFVTTCDFEVDILRGKRQYRWTVWVYLCVRVSTLVAFTFIFTIGSPSTCRARDIAIYTLSYTSTASASLTIIIRITALWNHHRAALALSFIVWSASTALNIQDLTLVTSKYVTSRGMYAEINEQRYSKRRRSPRVGFTAVGDYVCGPPSSRQRKGRSIRTLALAFPSGKHLALATIAEVPCIVMLGLNLNSWNVMLPPAALTILAIAATRMYRDLADYECTTRPLSSGNALPESESYEGAVVKTLLLPCWANGAEMTGALDTNIYASVMDIDRPAQPKRRQEFQAPWAFREYHHFD